MLSIAITDLFPHSVPYLITQLGSLMSDGRSVGWSVGGLVGQSMCGQLHFHTPIETLVYPVPMKDHEYCNTQPAFKGLEDGLKAAFAPPILNKTTNTSHGANINTALQINRGRGWLWCFLKTWFPFYIFGINWLCEDAFLSLTSLSFYYYNCNCFIWNAFLVVIVVYYVIYVASYVSFV